MDASEIILIPVKTSAVKRLPSLLDLIVMRELVHSQYQRCTELFSVYPVSSLTQIKQSGETLTEIDKSIVAVFATIGRPN